jgi:hypothetical protein
MNNDDPPGEFYWTLRFQDTTNGPLERIELSDANLAALTCRNSASRVLASTGTP